MATQGDALARLMRIRRWLHIVAWCSLAPILLFILLLPLPAGVFMFRVPYALACGWVHYLAKVIPMVRVNSGMIWTGIAAFALAVMTTHLVLGWLWRQRKPDRPWRLNSTCCICLIIPVLFAISIAAGGVLHQTGWLMREKNWIEDVNGGRFTKNISNARQIITALRIWSSDHDGRYPERLEQLFTDGALDNNQIFYYLSPGGGVPELFVYLTGLTDSDGGSLPLVIGPHSESNGRWLVGMNDSSVSVVKREKASSLVQNWRNHVAAHQSDPK